MDPRKAVQDGWTAERNGKTIDSNPYERNSVLFDAWRIGWQDSLAAYEAETSLPICTSDPY